MAELSLAIYHAKSSQLILKQLLVIVGLRLFFSKVQVSLKKFLHKTVNGRCAVLYAFQSSGTGVRMYLYCNATFLHVTGNWELKLV